MSAKKSFRTFCGAFLLMCLGAGAADCIVDVGESRRLEGNQSLGRIFCNGELSIADDAIVTCTSFVMASGVVQNVKVTLGENASLTVSGASSSGTGLYECAVGMDGGGGLLELGTNAVMRCTLNACMQAISPYAAAAFSTANPFPSTAKISIHLKKGAVLACQNADGIFQFDGGSRLNYSNCGRFVGNTILLDDGAYMNFCSYQQYGRPDTRILFNGGKIRQSIWNNSRGAVFVHNTPYWLNVSGASLYLASTNNNDIVIDKGNWGPAIFAVGAGSQGSIKTEGSGNFVLHSGQSSKNAWINGSLWTAFVNSKDMPAGLLAFGHSGAIRFEGTMWLWLISVDRSQMTRDNFIADGLFNGSRNLEIGPGVHLDVFGNRLNAKKLTTAGDVFSTSTANMGMLKFGADGSNSELYDIGTNVVCVKCGTGSLSMSNATDMAGLSVTTGAVNFVANASGPVHIRSLSMGANTSFALGGNRPFTVDDLTLDASASVAVDRFAPPAGGSLNLLSFAPQSFPAMLPFTAQATQTRTNLGSWSLYYAGALQGAVGTADPPICVYNHHLCLGIPGMTLSVW